ncbi:MAG: hypothetical protein KAG20_08720 [Cocleimonas sp.]|nr:hypothetical protein [Cocleimonas sp.]
MTNPYDPPTSNIEVDEPISDRRIGWKIFFLLMLAFELFGFYAVYESILDDSVLISDLVGLFIYPIMLLGLFGYAFKYAFFHQNIWKIFFPISLLMDFWVLLDVFQASPDINTSLLIIVMSIILIVPILILQYLVLYRYAFTDKAPWDK